MVPCPNLTEQPFGLSNCGLSGDETLIDVGGVKNLLPLPKLDKVYSMSRVLDASGSQTPRFIVGAGAGPHHKCNGKISEVMLQMGKEN